jgi:MFS family permease
MGILATVAGALMTLVPIVLNQVINATSWRMAWLVAAAAVAAIVVPIGWFGLVDRPADVGQRPDGDSGPRHREDTVEPRGSYSYTRGEAVRTLQFWILALIGAVSGMLVTGLNFHQIDMLGEAGLSSGQAAAMFLPQIVGSSVTALGTGYLLDRVGVRFVPAVSMLLMVIVHLLAANLEGGWMIVGYAVSMGAAGGTVRAALSTMIPGYFGTGHIGSIQGIMTVSMVAGSAVGPVLLAVVHGATESYQSANLILAAIPVLALVVSLFNRSLPDRLVDGSPQPVASAV